MPVDFLDFFQRAEVYDNVATVVYSKNLPLNTFISGYVQVAANRVSTGDNKSWFKSFTAERRAAGAVLGTVVDVFTPFGDSAASAWDVSIGVNGNNVELRVTGQAATATTQFAFKAFVMVIQ
jgi:hypothetical protein